MNNDYVDMDGKDHIIRISSEVWDYIQEWAKQKALRRKDVDVVGLSFNDLLKMYINDHGGDL